MSTSGSSAASVLASHEDAGTFATSVTDEVATIARKELAPLAGAIDAGTVYPEELLRRFGSVGAWSSHLPKGGAADLRCAIQSMAAIGEVCGATAFMAWCQDTLVWYAANSSNPKLVAKFAADFASGARTSPSWRARSWPTPARRGEDECSASRRGRWR